MTYLLEIAIPSLLGHELSEVERLATRIWRKSRNLTGEPEDWFTDRGCGMENIKVLPNAMMSHVCYFLLHR